MYAHKIKVSSQYTNRKNKYTIHSKTTHLTIDLRETQASADILLRAALLLVGAHLSKVHANAERLHRRLDATREHTGRAQCAATVDWQTGGHVAHSGSDKVLDDARQCYPVRALGTEELALP